MLRVCLEEDGGMGMGTKEEVGLIRSVLCGDQDSRTCVHQISHELNGAHGIIS